LPRKWSTLSSTNSQSAASLLAHDKVRHVGEAVAVILAENRHLAEDALSWSPST
jgi:CO/xanthine dehydrogenase Mo-binding subunit